MKCIESLHDKRLVVLVQCLDNLLGTLALNLNEEPDLILYKSLYQASQKVLAQPEQSTLSDRTFQVYPVLKQLITGEPSCSNT